MKKLLLVLSVLLFVAAGANAVIVQPGYHVRDTIVPAHKQQVSGAVVTQSQDNQQNQPQGNGKNQTVALVLAIIGFFGLAGLHRFYLGYTGIGIIQLFTGGLFGIWTIIDIIRIINGSLKPKDGYYAETF